MGRQIQKDVKNSEILRQEVAILKKTITELSAARLMVLVKKLSDIIAPSELKGSEIKRIAFYQREYMVYVNYYARMPTVPQPENMADLNRRALSYFKLIKQDLPEYLTFDGAELHGYKEELDRDIKILSK